MATLAAERTLTRKDRAALAEMVWRRLVFDAPPWTEPTPGTAIHAEWRAEGRWRATLGFLGLARTLDEHARDGEPAVQPFPVCPACAKDDAANEDIVVTGTPPTQRATCRAHGRRHKPYFRPITEQWQTSGILNFEKLSRQIMGSWWAVAIHLHLALTTPGKLIGFQSSNLPKARELLDRAAIIYKTLPAELQRFGPMSDSPKAPARKVEDEIVFRHVDEEKQEALSRIIAIPSTPAAVRMYTFTALFIDECQHWEMDADFEDAYGAAIACVKGGGRLCTVSSVGRPDSYHHRLCTQEVLAA